MEDYSKTMTKLVFSLLGLMVFGLSFAQGSPFVDVAPCHWATEAIQGIAGQPEVSEAQALGSNYLAENSLVQVFEGLKCGDLNWSAYFMSGVPSGTAPQGTLTGFSLDGVSSSLAGPNGTVTFSLSANIDGQTYTREGSAALSYDEGRWRVAYPSLAALELPVFP